MTKEQMAELRALAEGAWSGPWRARTFEIDCPCPNGSHCGDSHTCEEVEAPEEYPNGSPGEPAADGEGQCVVQISVPGLETFAKPTAAFIAAARTAVPELLDALERAERERDEALELARSDREWMDAFRKDAATEMARADVAEAALAVAREAFEVIESHEVDRHSAARMLALDVLSKLPKRPT